MFYKISVVIPTINRTTELFHSLQTLAVQTRAPFEIIVMDQNKENILDEPLKAYPQVKHLKNTEPGLVKNYNKCLNAAKGDIVIFLDDDVSVSPFLIERTHAFFEEDLERKVAAVAGRVKNRVGDLPLEKIKKIGDYNTWNGQFTGNFNYDRALEVDGAQGALMIFRREKLFGVGGFDEGFEGSGYYFEPDACMRLKDKGYKIMFEPTLEIDHHMAPRGGARIDKVGGTYYFIKNGIRLQKRHAFFWQWPSYWLWCLAYVTLKSLYNLDFKIFTRGLKAIVDGVFKS